MSTKKRFSIAPDLASGIRHTIQSASTNQKNTLHYDMMSLDMLEPDPNNPRKLLITEEEIIAGLNPDPNPTRYQKKVKELEALKELAESIKRIGIKNAIEVYKDGNKYRIVTGERRYWAALLAGQKSVPVRISQKPDEFNLRYTQWVENINRKDLSLWEKYNNLLSIADAYWQTHQEKFTESALQTMLGISAIQAYRYYTLLNSDEIIPLLAEGKLNNLKVAQELISMKDKGAQKQIIAWALSSKEELTSLTHYKEAVKKAKQPRPTNTISLGKVSSSNVAKHLFDIVLSDERYKNFRQKFNNINWSSTQEIKKALQQLIMAMEQTCQIEEIA